MHRMKILSIGLLLVSLSIRLAGQSAPAGPAFLNPDLPVEQRVGDLLSRMTLDEKISQLSYDAPGIERLALSPYNWWNECLHGVARAGYATVFPQAVSMAASWNRQLIKEVGVVTADEARAKHHEFVRRGQRGLYQGLTFWSPNINIFRDPRWGRGHETYGEDPYLTGQLGKAFVEGLQGDDPAYLKVVATAKHFAVHSGPEASRHAFDAQPSERDLRETYLPAFRTLVEEAKVYSVMGAYNRLRGQPACASPLLFDILRREWGFEGYVVSDCWAISDIWQFHKILPDDASAAALAIEAGCDLECGSSYKSLREALARGLATEAAIDRALRRLLTARFRLGMFDPPERVAYANIPFSIVDSPAHRALAGRAASESIVLLQNDGGLLPFSKNLRRLAVIGPNADDPQALWGNYNGIPRAPVTVLQGLRNKLSPQTEVLYAQGCVLADGLPAMQPVPAVYLLTPEGGQGLKAEYFANTEWSGSPLWTTTDAQLDFAWDINPPHPQLSPGNYSVRWTGYLLPPVSGVYHFSEWAKPYMDFSLGDSLRAGGTYEHHAALNPRAIFLEGGKKYALEVRYKNFYGDASARFMWAPPPGDLLAEAQAVATQADAVVLVLGLNERLEGEEMRVQLDGFDRGDRTHLNLPQSQQRLLEAVVSSGKPVALVLLNGGALSVNWAADHVPAILTAGYPGQEGGSAVADVLFGDYNPAGRLPVTYYQSVDQLPAFDNYDMEGRTYRYFRGKPLYPFGHGLSYTTFDYYDLQLPAEVKTGEEVRLSVTVRNTGRLGGDEVVQLYLTDEEASTPRPIRQLLAFERVQLRRGEARTISFTLGPEQLALINADGQWAVEPGWFTVSVGGKQPGFAGRADAATTDVVQGRFRLRGLE